MVVSLSGYAEALDALFARTTGAFKFGLERTYALLDALGDPQRAYPVIHIAGTNGKGSTVATAYALLRDKGLRVARYTSPHLVDFRERILVNDSPIPAQDIVAFIDETMPLVERIGASFFEVTTALAFRYFARESVDVALVEAGLGGRLDSTNVVVPVAAGVTSIGFDHMEYLGPTLEHIAAEKAGIFKRGVPAVIGEPDVTIRALLALGARDAGAAPVHIVAEESSVEDVRVEARGTRFTLRTRSESAEITTPLVGRHQSANFAFTVALLDAAGDRFRVSLADAARLAGDIRLAGRFQRSGRWIFDVAHNLDGARTLRGSLETVELQRPLTALLCVLGDKEWRAMMDELAGVVDAFVLTDAPTAPRSRAWPLADALAYAEASGYQATAVADFDEALARVAQEGGTTLVTGSFHTVGDAMARLHLSPLGG